MELSRPLGLFSLTKAGVQIGCMFVYLSVCLSVRLKTRSCLSKKAQDPGPQKFQKKYYGLGTFLLIIFYYGTTRNSISNLPKQFTEEAQS